MVIVTSPLISTFAEAETQRFRSHHRPSASATKYIERRFIQAWKKVTSTFHKPDHSLSLPEGFVLMNARRRSMRIAHGTVRP
ncbi:uncharacterized protein STEHIDRAFT_157131 [Stereum hirsutum FP-91666 SS1]|uniref:uncharacterized protein n=1 Tax=Stereum hirsutum (strain FP-91666) TaxID=721885 RepID=UPI000444A343|nr:uncharacterized protein STEHIDRAFT_157131 [Stereum hirsutum FP-91666 SS1]EIM86838.1 hypothetical protein STEHIDRAFT_157131 [Stereum hirsutum FP-91666 SS1]